MKHSLLPLLVACLMAGNLFASSQLPSDAELRRMAAQMLMVGFRGDSVSETSDAARYVRDLGVGAVILFDVDLTGDATIGSRNITSRQKLQRMTAQLQRWGGGRLLIALDQEGGRVQRLKPQYGYEQLPSAAQIGQMQRSDSTRHYARLMARQLSQSGVNINLAPVVDLLNPDTPGLGAIDRCYSASPSVVAWHAGMLVDEHHRQGVMCTLKHFPGHGNATSDSHWGLVDVTDTWQPTELRPYELLIGQDKVDLVMTAHIFNRTIDPDYPATLSHKTLTGVLRRQLHYDGVILSDDMYMQGIIDHYQIEPALVLAINAGCDMLCVGNNISTGFEADRPFRLVDIIVQAVKDGRIALSRIQEANRRINSLKNKIKQ